MTDSAWANDSISGSDIRRQRWKLFSAFRKGVSDELARLGCRQKHCFPSDACGSVGWLAVASALCSTIKESPRASVAIDLVHLH